MRRAVFLIVAVMLVVTMMQWGCAAEHLNESNVSHATPIFDPDTGELVGYERGAAVSQKGGAAVKNAASLTADHFNTQGDADPWVVNFNDDYSWAHGHGPFRAITFFNPGFGRVTMVGEEDMTVEETSYTRTMADGSSATFTLRGFGSITSSVRAVIVQALEVTMGQAFIAATEAEKEWRIERVRELVGLGKSVSEAVAEVAGMAFLP